jgi:WD40 repeat protein
MNKCYYFQCYRKGEVFCECDFKFRSCEKHYYEDHKVKLTQIFHKKILENELMEKVKKLFPSILQNLKKVLISNINKSKQMVQTINQELKKKLHKIYSKIKKLEKLLTQEEVNEEMCEILHKGIEIEDKGYDINTFSDISKNYLRIIINKKEDDPPKIDISSLLDKNQSLKKINLIEFDNNLKVQQIFRRNNVIYQEIKSVEAMTTTKDKKYLVYANQNHDLKIWNLHKKYLEFELSSHEDKIEALVTSNDNKHLISISKKKTIVWDLLKGVEKYRLLSHRGCVETIVITNNGKYGISGGEDWNLVRWTLNEKGNEKILGSHCGIKKIVVNKADTKVFSCGRQNIIIWNLQTLKSEGELRTGSVETIAFTNDENYAVSGSEDGTINVWDLRNKLELNRFRGHLQRITYVGITSDNKYAVSVSEDNDVRIWNIEQFQSKF